MVDVFTKEAPAIDAGATMDQGTSRIRSSAGALIGSGRIRNTQNSLWPGKHRRIKGIRH